MSHCLHQVPLSASFSFSDHHFLCQHKAGHYRLLLAQKPIQHLQTGRHALGQRATNHCIIATHSLQDDTHIANGAPLYGQAGQVVVAALLAHSLHGGVGEPVVALASVSTATADRGEDHKLLKLWALLPSHAVEKGVGYLNSSQPLVKDGRRYSVCVTVSNLSLLVKIDGSIIFGFIDINELLWGQILQHAIFKDLHYGEKFQLYGRPYIDYKKKVN